MLRIRTLTNGAEIQAYLETDRTYAAYAIGDLDDGFFSRCVWYMAEVGGTPQALALIFGGFDPPVLFLMGSGDGAAALLNGPIQARRVYITAREEHLEALGVCYHWGELWPMWRMALTPAGWAARPDLAELPPVRRLIPSDVDRLLDLYQLGGGDAFDAEQLIQGVFYGIEQDGRLAAVAGTHLVSAAYSVGAVGNVMTHPNYRGRGYAQRTTAAVCGELVHRGIATIVLNVRQDNAPAVRAYEKLGFARACPYYEGVLTRRE